MMDPEGTGGSVYHLNGRARGEHTEEMGELALDEARRGLFILRAR